MNLPRCLYSEWEATSPSGESGAGSDSGPPSGLSGRRSFRSGSTPGGFGSTVFRSSFAGGGSLGSMSSHISLAYPLPAPGCVHAGLDSGLSAKESKAGDEAEEGTHDSAEHGPQCDRHPEASEQAAQEHPSTEACVETGFAALLERDHSIDEPCEEPANGSNEDHRGPSCPRWSRHPRDEEAEEPAHDCAADHQPKGGLLHRSVQEDHPVEERCGHEKNGSREDEDGAPHGRSIAPCCRTVHYCSYLVALKPVTVAIEVRVTGMCEKSLRSAPTATRGPARGKRAANATANPQVRGLEGSPFPRAIGSEPVKADREKVLRPHGGVPGPNVPDRRENPADRPERAER